jgi:hypothetical protein
MTDDYSLEEPYSSVRLISSDALVGRRLPLSKGTYSSVRLVAPNTTSSARARQSQRRCSGAAALHTEDKVL